MQILWTAEAVKDRHEIWNFIADDNPTAADNLDLLFMNAVRRLEQLPRLGRPGRIGNTRELFPHEHYRLIYEVNGDMVIILALVHTARLWPRE